MRGRVGSRLITLLCAFNNRHERAQFEVTNIAAGVEIAIVHFVAFGTHSFSIAKR